MSEYGTVQLWDLRSSFIKTLGKHNDSVYSVAFSPDGNMIVSGNWNMNYENGSVKLWQGSRRSWLELCCDRLHYHPVFKNLGTEEQKQACETFKKYIFNPQSGSEQL